MSRYQNYITKATCFNCRKQVRLKIPRGIAVDNRFCPKCGCKAMVPGFVKW
ncbi:hypothetical protein LCGC14_2695910 [marine sediment metagenome]|uniref:Uncharacterized protein n=1 Tax=marine sediment metagenome TaxID=412755 RepID=A0A0F8ZH32_9ZZZZ